MERRVWNCFGEHTQDILDFVVELRNLARGRLDRHAQVQRMCQLTAHRCCSDARSRASHSSPANERVIASFLFLTAFISIGEATTAIKYRQITEPTYRSKNHISYCLTQHRAQCTISSTHYLVSWIQATKDNNRFIMFLHSFLQLPAYTMDYLVGYGLTQKYAMMI